MYVCVYPPVRMAQLISLDEFSWNLFIVFFFRKSAEEFRVSFKSDKNDGHFK